MKRILLPLLALCLCLTACGGTADEAGYDPAAAAQALLDSGAFTQALDALDKETACTALYGGLDAETVEDCAVYASLSAGAEEIAVLKLSSAGAAETALTALEDRVAEQREALESYQPQEVGKLDSAIVEQKGNTVLLVVAADAALARSTLDELN